METHHVTISQRDEDKRRIYGLMLGFDKRHVNRLTIEELEDLCITRGYIKRVEKDGS